MPVISSSLVKPNGIIQNLTNFVYVAGRIFIKKLPWMPKENETYFIPNIEAGEARSTECQWKDDYKNKQRYKNIWYARQKMKH